MIRFGYPPSLHPTWLSSKLIQPNLYCSWVFVVVTSINNALQFKTVVLFEKKTF